MAKLPGVGWPGMFSFCSQGVKGALVGSWKNQHAEPMSAATSAV
jgi:hypothetical protein